MSFTEPEIKHHFGGGIYAKEMQMPADYLLLHLHNIAQVLSIAQNLVKEN
jgi:hypothetical protein